MVLFEIGLRKVERAARVYLRSRLEPVQAVKPEVTSGWTSAQREDAIHSIVGTATNIHDDVLV
jgi:hypothetical protein